MDIKELLTSGDKGRDKAQGVLCFMFRNTLLWRKVNYHNWVRAMGFYFEKPHNQKNQDRGNLNKALVQADLGWDSFKKGMDLLNPYRVTLTIELTWKSGTKSTYTIEIDPAEDESDVILVSKSDAVQDTNLLNNISHKHRDKPKNTLARLYNEILRTEEIDLTRWNALLEAYAEHPLSGLTGNKKETATAVGSIQRQLFEPRLSWNNFRKGLAVLGAVQEDYILTVDFAEKPVSADDHVVTHITIKDPFAGKSYER